VQYKEIKVNIGVIGVTGVKRLGFFIIYQAMIGFITNVSQTIYYFIKFVFTYSNILTIRFLI